MAIQKTENEIQVFEREMMMAEGKVHQWGIHVLLDGSPVVSPLSQGTSMLLNQMLSDFPS